MRSLVHVVLIAGRTEMESLQRSTTICSATTATKTSSSCRFAILLPITLLIHALMQVMVTESPCGTEDTMVYDITLSEIQSAMEANSH